MTPEHWQQINEALDGALDLPPSERAAYLDAHCGDHATLRRKVATLVAAYEQAQSFLEEPLGQYAAPVMPAPGEDLLEGKRVGPYRLLRRIARVRHKLHGRERLHEHPSWYHVGVALTVPRSTPR